MLCRKSIICCKNLNTLDQYWDFIHTRSYVVTLWIKIWIIESYQQLTFKHRILSIFYTISSTYWGVEFEYVPMHTIPEYWWPKLINLLTSVVTFYTHTVQSDMVNFLLLITIEIVIISHYNVCLLNWDNRCVKFNFYWDVSTQS